MTPNEHVDAIEEAIYQLNKTLDQAEKDALSIELEVVSDLRGNVIKYTRVHLVNAVIKIYDVTDSELTDLSNLEKSHAG